MKIIDKKPKPSRVYNFDDLLSGDVFTFEDIETFTFMKTSDESAVRLNDGILYNDGDFGDVILIRLDTELILRGYNQL